MKITCQCPACAHTNRISSWIAADRIELARKKGAEFEVRCTACGANVKIHVDDVCAESDRTLLYAGIAGVVIGAVLTVWLWNAGYVAVFALCFPIIMVGAVAKHENNKIKLFNYGFYDSKRSRK
jgi:hypothetical protein